jgi:hypothetical protein
MSHEMSGSEKLKAECQTMASLTPEEISQIASGLSGFSAVKLPPAKPEAYWVSASKAP